MPFPAAPGSSYRSLVSVTFTADGEAEAFDAAAFKANLRKLFPKAIDVLLTITAGSVIIDALIVMPSTSSGGLTDDATRVRNELANSSPEDLSKSLGVTLTAVSTPTVESGTVSLPAAPPPSPATPPPTIVGFLDDLFSSYGSW